MRQVSQASENVLLGRAIPARECACTRTRRRAHEMCTREVDLDDGGQTLMINYYSALLYCGKILILQQKSLVRGTRSAALTKQKVSMCWKDQEV